MNHTHVTGQKVIQNYCYRCVTSTNLYLNKAKQSINKNDIEIHNVDFANIAINRR